MPKAFLLKRAVEGETSTIYGNSNNVNSDGESLTQTSGFRGECFMFKIACLTLVKLRLLHT